MMDDAGRLSTLGGAELQRAPESELMCRIAACVQCRVVCACACCGLARRLVGTGRCSTSSGGRCMFAGLDRSVNMSVNSMYIVC